MRSSDGDADLNADYNLDDVRQAESSNPVYMVDNHLPDLFPLRSPFNLR